MAKSALEQAAEDMCTQLRQHALVCERDPTDAVAVVRQGELLRQAMLTYEQVLGEVTGWSNPLRHLDDQDSADSAPPADDQKGAPPDRAWVHVVARYYLRIDDRDNLLEFVSQRLDVTPSDQVEAVKALYGSDGWDPSRYPDELWHVDDVGIDVYLEE